MSVLNYKDLRGGLCLRYQLGEPVEPDPDYTGGGTRCSDDHPAKRCVPLPDL